MVLFPVAARSGRASRVEGRVAATVGSNPATSDSDDMGEVDGLAPGEFE